MSDDKLDGLGDVLNNELLKSIDPMLPHLGRGRWIVKPEWQPPVIDGLEGVQALVDKHVMQRLWQLVTDQYTLLKRGIFRTQKVGWIDPPATSEPEDRVSETGVALSNGVAVTVLSYTVPDVHYAVFKSFGHALDDASQWGIVSWTIQVNKRPYRTYNAFLQQRGPERAHDHHHHDREPPLGAFLESAPCARGTGEHCDRTGQYRHAGFGGRRGNGLILHHLGHGPAPCG